MEVGEYTKYHPWQSQLILEIFDGCYILGPKNQGFFYKSKRLCTYTKLLLLFSSVHTANQCATNLVRYDYTHAYTRVCAVKERHLSYQWLLVSIIRKKLESVDGDNRSGSFY